MDVADLQLADPCTLCSGVPRHPQLVGSVVLNRRPSDAAIQALRDHGCRVWEVVTDQHAKHKFLCRDSPGCMDATHLHPFAVSHVVLTTDAPEPAPRLYESWIELPYVQDRSL